MLVVAEVQCFPIAFDIARPDSCLAGSSLKLFIKLITTVRLTEVFLGKTSKQDGEHWVCKMLIEFRFKVGSKMFRLKQKSWRCFILHECFKNLAIFYITKTISMPWIFDGVVVATCRAGHVQSFSDTSWSLLLLDVFFALCRRLRDWPTVMLITKVNGSVPCILYFFLLYLLRFPEARSSATVYSTAVW